MMRSAPAWPMAPWLRRGAQGWNGAWSSSHNPELRSAYTTGMFVVMNKAKWNALPPDVQRSLMRQQGMGLKQG
jgi:hypothetical protein